MAKNDDRIKVLVCDDHSIFRAGLVGVLRADPDIIVVGEARDGLAAIEKTMELEPDVVILDVLMPRCDGLQALDTIKKRFPNVKVLMLTISLTDDHLLQCLRLGAQGYLSKNADIDDDAFKGIEAIIHSMTPAERQNPKILNGSRRKRIAAGAGTTIQEVNKLIKQFAETSKMMKMMTSGGGRKMANLMNQLKR